MEQNRENVGVRKCPKCGSVWYTALPKCAFCGIEGEEVKGPISPSKLNLGRGGLVTPPAAKEPAEGPAPLPAAPSPAAPAPDPAPPAVPKVEEAAPPPPPTVEPAPSPSAPPTEASQPAPAENMERAPRPPIAPKPKAAIPLESRREEGSAPAPAAPQLPSATVPLVCGILGLLACIGLPCLATLRHDRVLGVLALLGWALLAPLGPCAWFSADRYAERCHALGFRPALSAGVGKTLGRIAAFLVTLEFSALAIFTAVQLLSGRLTELPWK